MRLQERSSSGAQLELSRDRQDHAEIGKIDTAASTPTGDKKGRKRKGRQNPVKAPMAVTFDEIAESPYSRLFWFHSPSLFIHVLQIVLLCLAFYVLALAYYISFLSKYWWLAVIAAAPALISLAIAPLIVPMYAIVVYVGVELQHEIIDRHRRKHEDKQRREMGSSSTSSLHSHSSMEHASSTTALLPATPTQQQSTAASTLSPAADDDPALDGKAAAPEENFNSA